MLLMCHSAPWWQVLRRKTHVKSAEPGHAPLPFVICTGGGVSGIHRGERPNRT